MTDPRRASLAQCRRPVIKIGSAVLAGAGRGGVPSLDRKRFRALRDDLAPLAARAPPRVLVSRAGGAIGQRRACSPASPPQAASTRPPRGGPRAEKGFPP